MTKRKTPEDWQELQRAVAEVLVADGYVAEIEKPIQTTRSVVNFDVYAQKSVGGHKTTIVAECKHWRSNVPQVVVHAFRAQIADLGADAGYLISSSGFQSGALEAARNTNIRLLSWAEFLEKFEPEGPPLAPGLRASAQIMSGTVTYHDHHGKLLPWMESKVVGGTVRRSERGGLLIWVESEAALPALQQANAAVGWKGLELHSSADSISTDPASPTPVAGVSEFTTAPGLTGLHPETGEKMTIPFAVKAKLEVSAEAYYEGGVLKGTWTGAAHTSLSPQVVPMQGGFSLRVQ